MARKPDVISTMAELHEAVQTVIEAANADPSIALRFLTNPLFLAQDLGYTLTDEMMHFARRRVRFTDAAAFERMTQLEKRVWELAGERFDLDSPEELTYILFTKLKLPRPPQPPRPKASRTAEHPDAVENAQLPADLQLAAPLPVRFTVREPSVDPLEPLAKAHPIMLPLLEYRQLEASVPRLAPRAAYDRIAEGKVELPVGHLTLQLNRKHRPRVEKED